MSAPAAQAAGPARRCDLCGSQESRTLVSLETRKALRSDRVIVWTPLEKLQCAGCGLVWDGRRGLAFDAGDYYRSEYTLGRAQEHVFYTADGPVPRSRMLAEWLVSVAGDPWRNARNCLEVGAGAGHLLEQMARRHPRVSFEGLEPGEEAASLARGKGLAVRQGGIEGSSSRSEDVIYSVAVIEHVASPTRFLESVREWLRPGGWLLLCQPTQDVPSYDIFFVDHLHHFGTAHLAAYARKCGFEERRVVVGHPWMPNFSLHAWRKSETPAPTHVWEGPPAPTTCARTVTAVLADMQALDVKLSRLAAAGRRVAAFGLNEVYALARAYSSLGEFPLVCGFDDDPARPEHARLPFPVVVPEQGAQLGVQDAILSMNRVYYPQALSRLESLGILGHPVLSS